MVSGANYNSYIYNPGYNMAYQPQYPVYQPMPQPMPQSMYYPMNTTQGMLPSYPVQAPMPYSPVPPVSYMTSPVMVQPLSKDTFVKAPVIKEAKTDKAKLSLFFINDMHGHIDNMTNILGASMQFDKDKQGKGVDTIKLSSGDNYTGGDVQRNGLMMKFLDFIGIEATAVGNHEYDASTSSLCDVTKDTKVQFLAANAMVPQGSDYYNNIQRSTVIEKNGNKYGVVGLTPFDLETVASKKEALEGVKPSNLEESARLAQIEIDKLRAQGINKIILLSHIGIDQDKKIASMLDGVDIIQGGHSHNLTPELKEGETILKSKSGEPVILVQAGENGKYAGILDVEFNEDGLITAASLDFNKAELEKSPVLEYIKNTVLGETPVVGAIKAIDPTPENRRIVPCAWTNLLCDAMKSELNTDIAFVNAANMRKVPKPGNVTERDITDTTPLQNTLMVSKMTEKEIVRVIKEAAKTSLGHETGEPGIMHASGLTYKCTSDGDLIEMNFVDKDGNKKPIDINNPDDTKFYTVAHDTFVAEVRDNPEYPGMFVSAHKNQEVQHFNFDKDKAAADYIRKLPNNDELVITDDHRIEIIEKDGSIRTLAGGTLAGAEKTTTQA